MVSIMLNMLGWAAWMGFVPPDGYNFAFLVVYAWTLWVLLGRDGADVGRIANMGVSARGSRYAHVHCRIDKSSRRNAKHTGET